MAATPTSIKNAREFLDFVAIPDVHDLIADRTSLRLAYHACVSLYSLRDWVFEDYRNTDWKFQGTAQPRFTTKGALEKHVIDKIEPSFKYVADIANAVKHKRLERAHTKLWGAANTEIKKVMTTHGGASFGSFSFGIHAFGQLPTTVEEDAILVQIDQQWVPVLIHIIKVYKMWPSLMHENAW